MKKGFASGVIETIFLAAVAGLTVAAYLPSLSASWQFDDLTHIVNNPAVHMKELSLANLARAASESYLRNRPLSYLSFALDFYRADLQPRAFHLTNLLLHLLNTLLVWLLLRRLFMAFPLFSLPWPRTAALMGALLFALHPLQTQSVTYIVQRMNLLASLFSLAALNAWLILYSPSASPRGRQWPWAAAFLTAAVLGLLAKESAFSLFLLALVLDRSSQPKPFLSWLKSRGLLLSLFAVAVLIIALIFSAGSGGLLAGYKIRDFTPAERLLTQPRVLFLYLSLWLWPAHHRLSLEHDLVTSTSPFHPLTTFPAVLLIAGLTLAAFLYSHRRPLLALGWLWFIAGLALESSVLPLEMVFEHRMYLPLVGLFLVAADLAVMTDLRRPAVVLVSLIVLLLAAGTFGRNHRWKNTFTLWRDAAAKAPGSNRAWSNLCAGALEVDRVYSAEPWCRRATVLEARSAMAWYHLGICFLRMGRFAEAEEALTSSLARDKMWAEAWYQLGWVQARQGKLAEAVKNLKRAVTMAPEEPLYWYHLGVTHLLADEKDEGCAALQEASSRPSPALPELRAQIERARQIAVCP